MRRELTAILVVLALLVGPLLTPLPAAAAPLGQFGTTYFFAEGSTNPPFDCWLLMFNPNNSAATATVTFLGTNGAATSRTVTILPRARISIFVNQVLPNADFGIRIESNIDIAAERAMYFRQDGTVVKGITTPSTTWLFGEGATAFPHQTWFLMLNPSSTAAASATLTFFLQGGGTQATTVSIPALSRASVFANLVIPNAAFSTRISSNMPIVAERAMYLANTGGGHASQGAIATAVAWHFAEGSTNAPFDTWFLILNPNPTQVRILMRFFFDQGGPGPLLDFNLPANSRFSLFANQTVPNRNFGATIISEGGQIVAERSMFFQGGAHNTLGSPALSTTWLFAEGSTAFPFQEFLLLMNPSGRDNANANVTFFFPDGSMTTRSVVVGGEGRTSIFVDLLIPQTAVSARVDSDLPVVAERSMYFSGGRGGTNTVGIQPVTQP